MMIVMGKVSITLLLTSPEAPSKQTVQAFQLLCMAGA